jgi:hypothetical protein
MSDSSVSVEAPAAANGRWPVRWTPAELELDIHAATNGRWMQIDLDEILEGIEFAGLPQRELICTYLDRRSPRRVFVRVASRRNHGNGH